MNTCAVCGVPCNLKFCSEECAEDYNNTLIETAILEDMEDARDWETVRDELE